MNEHHFVTICRNDCPAVVAAFLERMVEVGVIGRNRLDQLAPDLANWHFEDFDQQPWHMDADLTHVVNRETGESFYIKELLYPRDLPTQHDKPLNLIEHYGHTPEDDMHKVMLFGPRSSKLFVLFWLIDHNYEVMDTPSVVGDGRDCSGAALARIEYHTSSVGYTMVTYRVVIDV